LSNLPVVFVIGETGSTKTSTLVNCGLDRSCWPAMSIRTTPWLPRAWPTSGSRGAWCLWKPAANCFQSRNAGRACCSICDPAGRRRVPRCCASMPRPLRGRVRRRPHAAARTLQARLGEVSQRFGISFPVYVLFTRMNRVASSRTSSAISATRKPARFLGATLPMAQPGATRHLCEEQTRRLSAAFDGLFYSLADRRIVFLPRENDPQKSHGLRVSARIPQASQRPGAFLVDVCRPSQLRASPFCAGSISPGCGGGGARYAGGGPRASAQRSPFEAAGGATGIFRTGFPAPAAGAPPAQTGVPSGPGGRKVPQWVFLSHLFSDIVLRDENALGASAAAPRPARSNRVLLISAAALCLVFTIGSRFRFWQPRARKPGAGCRPCDSSRGSQRLEPAHSRSSAKARQLAESPGAAHGYEEQGAPLRCAGFCTAAALCTPRRGASTTRAPPVALSPDPRAMLASLQLVALPPAPADNYGTTYDTLKAYLITTSEWKRSTNWLSPVLVSRWSAGRTVDNLLPAGAQAVRFLQRGSAPGQSLQARRTTPRPSTRAPAPLEVFRHRAITSSCLSDASRRAKKVNFQRAVSRLGRVVVNNRDVLARSPSRLWRP